MGSEKVVFLVIFIHPFENSGGYFFRGRLFWWILDINLQNFVRGYFSKFSLRALIRAGSIANGGGGFPLCSPRSENFEK